MAKRPAKTLRTKKEHTKAFRELAAEKCAQYEEQIRNFQKRLKARRIAQADQEMLEKWLRESQSRLTSLEARRQRHELIQGDERLSVPMRQAIAKLEFHILRLELSHSSSRSVLREWKQDLAELLEHVERITNPPQPLETTNRAFRVGRGYPRQAISRFYDGHVWQVLKAHFEALSRTKGQQSRVRIVAAIPEKAEYLQLKERYYTKTVEALVSEAYETVNELQEELQQAYDNMPENLQDGPLGEARLQAADQLEDISGDQPEVLTCVASLPIVHYPRVDQSSRGLRAYAATEMLRTAAKAVSDYPASEVALKKRETKALEEFAEQLEEHADSIDAVEFPGMFG